MFYSKIFASCKVGVFVIPRAVALSMMGLSVLTISACASSPKSASESVSKSASAAASAYFVVVDQSEKGFVVFTSISSSTNPKKLAKIRKKVDADDSMTMHTWSAFVNNLPGYAKETMLVDDYPQVDVVAGLPCLLSKKYSVGAPWGLSWNGGIALTYRDYQRVRRSYKKYLKDPQSHKAKKDVRADPIYPNHHFKLVGCQQ